MSAFTPAVGQKTWLAIGKETTFGTAVVPGTTHAMLSNAPSMKYSYADRQGPRAIAGQTVSAPGPYVLSLAAKFEPDADFLGQILAYTMGAQTAPAHPSGSTVAYTSVLSFGSANTLPSFTSEYFRGGTDTVDMVGCCIDTLKLSLSKGKLGVDTTIVAQQEAIQASPITPTFSLLEPYTMEAPTTGFTYNGTVQGVGGQVIFGGMDLTLNNQLDKDYRTGGSQFVQGFPLGTRKVSGSFKAGFESNQQYLDFKAQGTTPLIFNIGSISVADAAATPSKLYFNLLISLPVCRLTTFGMPQKTSGTLYQTVNFDAFHDFGGGHDDMQITLTNLASAVF
jgi:hypothetical protein